VPLRIATSREPVAAVAVQNTFPAPSLVQDGLEATAPVSTFHDPHFVPLYSFTIMADFSLKTAQATCSLDTDAHEGLPMPVVVPVEEKPVQLACERGTMMKVTIRAVDKCKRRAAIDLVRLVPVGGRLR
jgi:hypothetical protein